MGKSQSISRAGEFWTGVNSLHVAPDSVTRASLIDALDAAQTKAVLPDGTFLQFHALTVPASEFGVLVPAHDLEFLNTLNHLYDCPRNYRENRRSRTKQVEIAYPMLNILGGTQPAYLASLLPEQAWGMGFTSRLIMVYSGEITPINLFDVSPVDEKLRKDLGKDLETMTQLFGAMSWAEDAQAMLVAWAKKGFIPVPIHSRLQNYNTRRQLHILKLCIISAVSRSNSLTIELLDVQRAQEWLLEAEARMPDIFREMAGTSDKAIIDDLHDYVWRLYSRQNPPKAIHESLIMRFLSGKVPADKVYRILDLAERSHILERDKTTAQSWKPGVKDNIPGVE